MYIRHPVSFRVAICYAVASLVILALAAYPPPAVAASGIMSKVIGASLMVGGLCSVICLFRFEDDYHLFIFSLVPVVFAFLGVAVGFELLVRPLEANPFFNMGLLVTIHVCTLAVLIWPTIGFGQKPTTI